MSSLDQSIFQTIFQQSAAPTVILKAQAPDYEVVAQNEKYRTMAAQNPSGKRAFELFVADPADEYSLHTYGILISAFETCVTKQTIVKLPPVLHSLVEEIWLQTDILPVIENNVVT